MFALAYGGEPADHATTAERIVELETQLAQAHWDVVKRRDAELSYNLRTFAELSAQAPGFDWAGWIGALGASPQLAGELVVRQPDYLSAFAALWSSADLGQWKDWARWRLIHGRAAMLTDEIVAEDFVLWKAPVGHRGDPRALEARRCAWWRA